MASEPSSAAAGAPGFGRQLGRLDRVVGVALAALAGVVALLIAGGDRAGLRVVAVSPPWDAAAVSTLPRLQVTFAQEIAPDSGVTLRASPPVSGTLQWRGRTLEWWPSEPLLPDTEYHLTLPAGLRSRQGRALLKPAEWRFRTGRPRILYLSWNEQGYNQILTVSVGGQDATPLTEAEWGVLDYGVAPGGEIVAYSAYREDRGTDLWVHEIAAAGNRLLLACPAAACSNPAWAADGRRLIYERRNLDQPGLPPGPPRLWWLDVASGETVPVFEDSQWLGSTARFSPDGRQISYIAPLSQAVEIYDLQSGEGQRFTSRSGEPAAWSPDSRSLIVTDVDLTGEQYAMRLYRHDLDGLGTHNISGTGPTDDNWPAYAPGGAWLAFNRKPASVPSGRQIWLMRPDGGDAQPLTDDPEAQYGPPIWSPDARSLLYQRYMPAEPSAEPGIWVLELATGESLQIAAAGTQPAWLP